MMLAAEKGHHECVSILVTSGADINVVGKSLEVTCTTCLRAMSVCHWLFRACHCPLSRISRELCSE